MSKRSPGVQGAAHKPPNHTLQRTGGQRRFVGRWLRQWFGVGQPPPLSVSVRADTLRASARTLTLTSFAAWLGNALRAAEPGCCTCRGGRQACGLPSSTQVSAALGAGLLHHDRD